MRNSAGITTNVKRGAGELVVLALLDSEPAHGYQIAKRIELGTNGVLSFQLAALYPLLASLEMRGLVKGEWQLQPNGRQRRVYRMTPRGREHLVSLRRAWRRFEQGFSALCNM